MRHTKFVCVLCKPPHPPSMYGHHYYKKDRQTNSPNKKRTDKEKPGSQAHNRRNLNPLTREAEQPKSAKSQSTES